MWMKTSYFTYPHTVGKDVILPHGVPETGDENVKTRDQKTNLWKVNFFLEAEL